ncbi:hypothetical protein L1887_36209 [Cichorium endivia]|nr:hypothetical protein L1887_36209 [Cichorium endivia]
MSSITSSLCLLPLVFFMMMVAFAESRTMVPPKSNLVSKNDDLKPVPTLEFTTLSPSSKPSRNDHKPQDEFHHFANKVEAYKVASSGPSEKGRGHK